MWLRKSENSWRLWNKKYDYESRIVKITKAGQTKAQFTYDGLGRRTEKKDLIDPNNTRRYYYNNNWQVLCEYDGQDVYQRHFAYGNYIDEVLFMITTGPPTRKFYVHDHLFSPAALIDKDGNVVERYEYDAYGKVAIMDASYNSRSESLYDNPYTFQGKQLDLLDNGGLELMSWPYRSYSTHLGRWTQAEKLGMIPNDNQRINAFSVHRQYMAGLNLYNFVGHNPVARMDQHGLASCAGGSCTLCPCPFDPSEPPDPSWTPSWSTWSFVYHYYFGNYPYSLGETVDLAEVGLLEAMRAAASPITTGCKQKAMQEISEGCPCNLTHVGGNCGGLVNAGPYIYVVGHTYVNASYSCPIERDFDSCCYKYTCTIDLSISDSFSDPADIFDWFETDWEPGGEPYGIVASWEEFFVGCGPLGSCE